MLFKAKVLGILASVGPHEGSKTIQRCHAMRAAYATHAVRNLPLAQDEGAIVQEQFLEDQTLA
jgi:hypothetical protein